MNFTELQSAVQDACALVADDEMIGTANTGALARLVNAGLHYYETANPNGWDWLIRNDVAFNTVASQERYTFTAVAAGMSGSPTVAKIKEIKLGITAATYGPWVMTRVPKEEADMHYPSTSPQRPEVYWVEGITLGLRPLPDAVYPITGAVIIEEPDLSAGADEPILPARFHEMIVEAATYLFFRREQNSEKAAVALAAYKDWHSRALGHSKPYRGPGRVRADAGLDR